MTSMPSQLDLFPSPALSRASDRETSREAAKNIAPKLGRLRASMLEVITRWGPITAMEAADKCVVRDRGNIESYRKRAKELVRLGLIVECEPRACRITKAMATTYRRKA